MNYKVSYVILDSDYPGAIVTQQRPPQLGEEVQLGEMRCKVMEIKDLLPPMGDFAYLHVSCKFIQEEE
ncbi:MAG: hypothetical protein ACP5HM_14590 [Anaerolineae bacterium]